MDLPTGIFLDSTLIELCNPYWLRIWHQSLVSSLFINLFFITKNVQSIAFIFIAIVTIFWQICSLAFYTEPQTKAFIYSTGIDYFNSVNHDQVQILNYNKYSLLVGIEPDLQMIYSEALFNQTP